MSKQLSRPVVKNIVPTVTFFDGEGDIPRAANSLLIRHILLNSPDCLFLMGSTGEGTYFRDNPQSKRRYIEVVLDTLSQAEKIDTIPVIVGIYGETADEAIKDMTNCLAIDKNLGIVLPPPLKTKLDSDAQFAFFSSVIQATKNPIYIYNNPKTFGGTEIDPAVVEKLLKFENFRGIKDSAGDMNKLIEYLKWLSSDYTVSCGKEGILAQFLEIVPVEKRSLVGIVPSISNLVNTCGKIFDLGIAGKDKEMIALQSELNNFRAKIYDSQVEKGKAQRGVKIAFQMLYKDKGVDIPIIVKPDFKRDVPIEVCAEIEETTKWAIQHQHMNALFD